MKRSGIFVVLCLALGAVRAEAQSQVPQVSLLVGSNPVVLGGNHPCLALLPEVPASSDIHLVMGVPGASVVELSGQSINISLMNPMVLLSSTTKGLVWWDRLPVPNDPSLVGLKFRLGAIVVEPSATVHVSALVPFGPIIEDSIQ